MSAALRFPLAKRLAPLKNRVDIVSPGLCGMFKQFGLLKSDLTICVDDVIQRLAPSLQQYVGGTIVDANPGVGLFSSKLHDFLKPRCHVLLEDKQNRYLKFLQPLLDAPNSRYHLRDWTDQRLFDISLFIKDGLLPDADGYVGPPPTTDQPNNSTLIVVNGVFQQYPKGKMRELNGTYLKANEFATQVRHGIGFPSRGPTRMLMWANQTEKKPLLPRVVDHRTKISTYLEAHCDVEEIVGFEPQPKWSRRETKLDVESNKRTAKRTKENKIFIPWERKRKVQTDDTADLSEVTRHWHQEVRELEEGFASGKYQEYIGRPSKPPVKGKEEKYGFSSRSQPKTKHTDEFKRLNSLQRVLTGQNTDLRLTQKLADKQAEIDQLDLDSYSPDLSKSDRETLLTTIDAKTAALKYEIDTIGSRNKYFRYFLLDDERRAFKMSPPLLQWDRRVAEPLTATTDEYHPATELSLLDFRAKEVNDLPISIHQAMYLELMTSSLCQGRGPTNLQELKTIAPGAYEALVPQVPALRDPRQGGRRDVDSVRNRTLTPKQLVGLAVAWDNWALKPPMEYLLMSGPAEDMQEFGRRRYSGATI